MTRPGAHANGPVSMKFKTGDYKRRYFLRGHARFIGIFLRSIDRAAFGCNTQFCSFDSAACCTNIAVRNPRHDSFAKFIYPCFKTNIILPYLIIFFRYVSRVYVRLQSLSFQDWFTTSDFFDIAVVSSLLNYPSGLRRSLAARSARIGLKLHS